MCGHTRLSASGSKGQRKKKNRQNPVKAPNVVRFAQYLRRVSDKTQFIVITHRRGTMEAANVLYGVTMQEDGVSKLLKLDLEQVDATLVS